MNSKLNFALSVLLLLSNVAHAEDSAEPRYKWVYGKNFQCVIEEYNEGKPGKDEFTRTQVEIKMKSGDFGSSTGSVALSDNRKLQIGYDHDNGLELTLFWLSPKDKTTAVRHITAGAGYEHMVKLSIVSDEESLHVLCFQDRSYVEDSSSADKN